MLRAMGLSLVVLCSGLVPAWAGEIELAEGRLQITTPESWVRKEPRSRIVEVEFEVPGAGEGVAAGRLTIMPSGGTVEQNIARWEGQFEGEEGPAKAQVEKLEVGKAKVHIVDLSGIFKDSPRGPMGPVEKKEGYRMLGAIIQTEGAAVYYVKLTGPIATLEKAEEDFKAMVRSVVVVD